MLAFKMFSAYSGGIKFTLTIQAYANFNILYLPHMINPYMLTF